MQGQAKAKVEVGPSGGGDAKQPPQVIGPHHQRPQPHHGAHLQLAVIIGQNERRGHFKVAELDTRREGQRADGAGADGAGGQQVLGPEQAGVEVVY